jgi:hypothetical protein
MPDLSSRSFSFVVSAARVDGDRMFAWSTTRPLSAGSSAQ